MAAISGKSRVTPPPETESGPGGSPRLLRKSPSRRWQNLKTHVHLIALGSKVNATNKIGQKVSGDAAKIAWALHSGIGPALSSAGRGITVEQSRSPARNRASQAQQTRVEAVDAELFVRIRSLVGISETNFFASLALQPGVRWTRRVPSLPHHPTPSCLPPPLPPSVP